MKEENFRANFKEGAKKIAPIRKEWGGEVPSIVKKELEHKKFYIRTFGCQANIRDEEIMAGFLKNAGMEKVDNPHLSNLAIINTCAVRENAVDKIYGEIGSFKANWDESHSFILILAGCAMEEEGLAEKLQATYPWVRLFIGTHEVPHLLEHLSTYFQEKKSLIRIRSMSGEVIESLPSLRLDSDSAFVNISYGCDKFCTYCIVPYTRGRERSRRKGDVLAECKKLVEEGYKEITLLGQNVNSYGLDLGEEDAFPILLEEVAKLGIPRLRFITSYPSQFTGRMIDVMAKYKNIIPWLHFPVQSGSNHVLKAMGRRYTREEYLSLVQQLKKKIPDIAITTDIIVAFPGETEEDFEETLSLCKEVGFSSAFTFIYSPRPGTPAAKKEQIPSSVAHDRFNRLKEVIDECTANHSSSMVGKTFEVLVLGPSKRNEEMLSGYATNGKLIHFKGPKYLKGCLVDVLVKESHVYSLQGELVDDPLIYKAKDIAYLLSKDPLFSEYHSLVKKAKESGELDALKIKLPQLKKEMIDLSNRHQDIRQIKNEYLALKKNLENSPLLQNLDILGEEVKEELRVIADFLGE